MSKVEPKVTKVYKPEVLKCPYCGSKLKFRFVISNRVVQFTSGKTVRIKNMVYGCDKCNNGEVYPSLTATKLAFKGYTYSSKIICMIDYYKNLHYSREKISVMLENKGVIVSDRNVDIINNKFQELFNIDKEKNIFSAYERMLDKYNEVRLAIDFITVNDTYYVIFYDFFNADMLAIFKFNDIEGEEAKEVFKKYLDEKYNIKIIVTAGVRSKIRKPLKEVTQGNTRFVSFVKF